MEKVIKDIFEQCRKNSRLKVKSTSYPALVVVEGLNKLIAFIGKEIKIDQKVYEFKVSRGSGFYPKNPWLALVKKGTKVSNALSVCICFSKNGNGFVVGLMYFTSANNKNFQTIKRDKKVDNFIDINGTNFRTTKNNDKFINPLEVHEKDVDIKKLISHLKSSFLLLKKYSANLI